MAQLLSNNIVLALAYMTLHALIIVTLLYSILWLFRVIDWLFYIFRHIAARITTRSKAARQAEMARRQSSTGQ
jgi:nucleoside permease NupC